LDRFMLKLRITYPTREEERAILDANAFTRPEFKARPVIQTDRIQTAREVVDAIYVDEKIKDYVLDIVLATRDPAKFDLRMGPYIRYGASPRASIYLTLAARAHAFLQGRGYVTPQDVKSIAPDILRHRVLPSYEAEAEELTSDDLVTQILDQLPVP
jgi:MoxR-like ATPase